MVHLDGDDSVCILGKDSLTFVNILYPDGGSYILGAARMIAFFFFVVLNRRNKKLVHTQEELNGSFIRGLILPSYAEYFYLLIGLNFVLGLTDLITSLKNDGTSEAANSFIIPIEMGLYHCLNEGLAIFLTRYGAGTLAFKKALTWGVMWGFTTAVLFFIEIGFTADKYGLGKNYKLAFIIFLVFEVALLLFYLTFIVVPINWLYRRPALKFYAQFNVLVQLFWIVSVLLILGGQKWSTCSSSFIAVILLSVVQPFVIFRTLQMDSQYWQGRGNNPLADSIWDQVDIGTASSMAEKLAEAESQSKGFPILHFGLISLEQRLGFVSGGFSRVYFGKYKGEKVALKMMFAMELTPDDVRDFYREAKVMHDLQHLNVVSCRGVCVMPPALTLVLEFCPYGSLFDFLYKPQRHDDERVVSIGSLRDSLSRGKDSSSRPSEMRRSSWDKPAARDTFLRMTEFLTRAENGTLPKSSEWGIRASPLWDDKEVFAKLRRCAPDSSSTADSHHSQKSTNSEASGRFSLIASEIRSSFGVPAVIAPMAGGNAVSGEAQSFNVELLSQDALYSDENSRGSRNSVAVGERGSSLVASALSTIKAYFGVRTGDNNVGIDGDQVPFAQLMPVQLRMSMMCDAVRAVAFLHSKRYMHCDIKSLNFLVCENFCVKLADFGETRLVDSAPRHACPAIQARHWAPPEVMAPHAAPDAYSMESDLFSLSIVLAEIINLKIPYSDDADRIAPQEWHRMLTKDFLRPTLPASLPQNLREAIESSWESNKADRPTAAELLDTLEGLVPG